MERVCQREWLKRLERVYYYYITALQLHECVVLYYRLNIIILINIRIGDLLFSCYLGRHDYLLLFYYNLCSYDLSNTFLHYYDFSLYNIFAYFLL